MLKLIQIFLLGTNDQELLLWESKKFETRMLT